MAKKKRQYDDDDGRVIAPMNVEGMPWYHKPASSGSDEKKEPVKLSFGETLALLGGVLKATLLVGLVFFGAFALVILFIQLAFS